MKITITLDDPTLKEKIVAVAKRKRRSMNAQIIQMLEEAVESEALSLEEEKAVKRIEKRVKKFLVSDG